MEEAWSHPPYLNLFFFWLFSKNKQKFQYQFNLIIFTIPFLIIFYIPAHDSINSVILKVKLSLTTYKLLS